MFRQSPTSIYICGQSNIGKSHLVISLVRAINNRLYKFKDFNKAVFSKTVTTEHWDGYIGQPIIVFDDHYKMQDGKQELDARETMNVVSCTNYYPSFAHLERKGTPVTSHFLIITSNVGWPITQYVPQAIHRRHKHHVIAVHNGKPYNADFSHLDLYYSIALIDPWQGNYGNGFNQLHDVPYTSAEFESFPHSAKYHKLSIHELVDVVCKDYQNESNKFKAILQSSIN